MNIDEIKRVSTDMLSRNKEIIAAYLYGSILSGDFYNDIDIGLLIDDNSKTGLFFETKIAGKLEKKLKKNFEEIIPVDVSVLNDKPLRFLFSMLKNSKIIYSRDDARTIQFESKIMKEYLDIKPHFDAYNNMRELRYANK